MSEWNRIAVAVGLLAVCASSRIDAQVGAPNTTNSGSKLDVPFRQGSRELEPNDQKTLLISAGNEPRQPLVYKFHVGQFTNFEVVNKMSMNVKFNGMNNAVEHDSTTRKQFRVVSIDPQGNALLEPMVVKAKMTATFGNAPPIVYDSESPESPPHQFKDVANSIGQPFARVQVAPNGELLKVTLLAGAPPNMVDSGNADPMLNFLTTFPKEPVGVGASWRDRFEVPVTVDAGLTQNVKLQRTYELTKIEGSLVTISAKTVVLTPVNDPKIEVQLMQRTPAGIIEFDLDRGCIVAQRTAGNKVVVGPFGPNTQASSTMELVERRLPGPVEPQPAKLETTSGIK